MQLQVLPSTSLHTTLHLPPNKSHYFRALILASLASGSSTISNVKESNDWHRGVAALRLFGAKIHKDPSGTYHIQGVSGRPSIPTDPIDCGNSGILFRFLMSVAAATPGLSYLTGDHSLKTLRPASHILQGLSDLGAEATSVLNNGHAPVYIRGPLQGGSTTVEGSDSQTISGLLIASLFAQNPTEIFVKNPGEKPWVDFTIAWLSRVGATITNHNNTFTHYTIPPTPTLTPFNFTIPRDWSAAFPPLLAAIITPNSSITLPGLDLQDLQNDRQVLQILSSMGADLTITPQSITARTSSLTAREIDCNDFIDQFMILAVAACFANGTTRLHNAAICRQKECDRISAMYEGLTAMGASVTEHPDGLTITGGQPLHGAKINGYSDHRIVMAFAVAALRAEGKTIITDAEYLEKSFADFVPALTEAGANFTLTK